MEEWQPQDKNNTSAHNLMFFSVWKNNSYVFLKDTEVLEEIQLPLQQLSDTGKTQQENRADNPLLKQPRRYPFPGFHALYYSCPYFSRADHATSVLCGHDCEIQHQVIKGAETFSLIPQASLLGRKPASATQQRSVTLGPRASQQTAYLASHTNELSRKQIEEPDPRLQIPWVPSQHCDKSDQLPQTPLKSRRPPPTHTQRKHRTMYIPILSH